MTEQELIKLLLEHKVPVHTWGTGVTQTLGHLLNNINEGEVELAVHDGVLTRFAIGARVFVYYCGGSKSLKLWEAMQVFKDGRPRVRNLESSLGEKVKPGEPPLEAAKRGMKEELSYIARGTVVKGPMPSDSYPGLNTRYVMHDFHVLLPRHLFKPEGYEEEQYDKTSYFVWKEVESVEPGSQHEHRN